MQEEMKTQEIPAKVAMQRQVVMRETLCSTMLHTVQIILIQYRFVIYFSILLAVFIVPLHSLLQIGIKLSGSFGPWCLEICDGIYIELAAIVVFMAVGNYNVLSRDEISMYPGNGISRFGGTVLAFHVMIAVFTLASMVGYLLQGGLLVAASHIWDNVVLGNAFSLSYLWHGAFRYLGLLLAVYALEVFWFVLTERFHYLLCGFFVLALTACLGILAVRGSLARVLRTVRGFFLGQGYLYAALMVVLFGVWAVLMVLSFALVSTVKAWKAADKKRLGITLALFYLIFIGGVSVYFGLSDGCQYVLDPQIFQQESNQQMEVVADISAWEEKDLDLLSSYDMSVKYRESAEESITFQDEVFASICCSASEAKSYGLSFDESKLDRDHIILLLGTRNLTFAGKDLGEDVLKIYQKSCKLVKDPMDERYQADNPEEKYNSTYYYQTETDYNKIILLNCLYGNLGMYLDDTTLSKDSYFWENVPEYLLRVVIYPDEWDQTMAQE